MKAPAYEIRVRGGLPDDWSHWFGGLALTHDGGGNTVLSGAVADQAALFGLLARIHDLGLDLLAVRRVDEEKGTEGAE